MNEAAENSHFELPNIVGILAHLFSGTSFAEFLRRWDNIVFSWLVIALILLVFALGFRRPRPIPGRLQGFLEAYVEGVDGFVTSVLGPKGRRYTPFIGTLFIYIFLMNFLGMIPFLKSPTSSWSTTMALAICVFFVVQVTAFKELGFLGYLDHLMGRPRGFLALSLILPVMMLFIHIIAEFARPLSLSLRLRTNIWSEDMLIALMTSWGLKGLPLLFFNSLLGLLSSLVQAVVFTLLSTVYLALVMPHEEHEE